MEAHSQLLVISPWLSNRHLRLDLHTQNSAVFYSVSVESANVVPQCQAPGTTPDPSVLTAGSLAKLLLSTWVAATWIQDTAPHPESHSRFLIDYLVPTLANP